ncbi:MAG TPA: adenylate/guanylate cyclase domain-containing protein [Gammaproteobacteria bacterium]|jgi:class 3 adenylate cyclase|nr:adenylate/guanylate cyclase domain-containing protein [Gammaproteobacteria bacterium]
MGPLQGFLKYAFVATAAPLLVLLLALLSRTPVVQDFEAWGYDLLVHAAVRTPPDSGILVVDFDNALLQKLRRYPVPRSTVAEVLQKVAADRPDLIGFDLLLSERRGAEEDKRLAAAMAEAGDVVVAAQLGSDDIPASEPLPEYCVLDAANPSSCKEGAALAAGFINMPVDDDGFVRRLFLLPPRGYPALPFPVVLASNRLRLPLTPCGADVCLGERRIALDGSSLRTALIGWPTGLPRVIPAGDVLAGRVPAGTFTGRVVLIGQSSAAGNDLHFTPQFRFRRPDGSRLQMPGTLVHAAALQTLLEGDAIRPLGATPGYMLAGAYMALALFLILFAAPRWSLPAVLLLMMAAAFIAGWLFGHRQLWQPFMLCELGLLLSLPTGFGYRFVEERWLKGRAERERHELMGLFSRYVSPQVAAEIWSRRAEITLAGEERFATVMFTDIRNFTAITAGKPPGEVLLWLNGYLTEMSAVIEAHHGFLNKFIGDGIMVLFGVPLSGGPAEDAVHALQTALDMLQRVEEWNRRHRGDPRYPEVSIGIGIHSGRVTAGNVGSYTRVEYSVIGAAVNLASRLESLTKEFHVPVIMTADTELLVRGRFRTRDLGETEVRGFEGSVRVYTVEGEIKRDT